MPTALPLTPMPGGAGPPAAGGAKPSDPESGAEGFLAALLALAGISSGATPGAAPGTGQAGKSSGQGPTPAVATATGAAAAGAAKPVADPDAVAKPSAGAATDAATAANAIVPAATPPKTTTAGEATPGKPASVLPELASSGPADGLGDAAEGDDQTPSDAQVSAAAKPGPDPSTGTVAANPAAPDPHAETAPDPGAETALAAVATGSALPAPDPTAADPTPAAAAPPAKATPTSKASAAPALPPETAAPVDPPLPKGPPTAASHAAADEKRPPGKSADRTGPDGAPSPAAPAPAPTAAAAPAEPPAPPPAPAAAQVTNDPTAAATEIVATAAGAAAPRTASAGSPAAAGDGGPSPADPAPAGHDGKDGAAPSASSANAAPRTIHAAANGPDTGTRPTLDTLTGGPVAGPAVATPRPAAADALANAKSEPAPPKAGTDGPSGTPQTVADIRQPTVVHQTDPTSPQRPATPPPVATQVAVHISRAVADGGHHLTVHLEPATLGRISVDVAVGKDGHLSASITAHRPDTLDLLQRDSRSLERALNDAGLKTDSGSLSFNLRGGENGYSGARSWTPTALAVPAVADELPLAPAAAPPMPVLRYAGSGGIDIRI